jgi:hypothetical protein
VTRVTKARRSWLAGLVVGVVAGFLFAYSPTIGAVVSVAFAMPAAVSRTRLAAISGFLIGSPAMWLLVMGLAAARCTEFDREPGQGCVSADVSGWIVLAAALLVTGLVASVAAARRS